jgi:hypothetical protein
VRVLSDFGAKLNPEGAEPRRVTADEDAAAALADRLAEHDGDPECARCPKPADYFLYEPGRVETFVCWEHVSPFSAAVDDPEEARPGRPLALSL